MLGAVGAFDWNGTVVMQSGQEFVVPKKNTFNDPAEQRYEGIAGYVGEDYEWHLSSSFGPLLFSLRVESGQKMMNGSSKYHKCQFLTLPAWVCFPSIATTALVTTYTFNFKPKRLERQ